MGLQYAKLRFINHADARVGSFSAVKKACTTGECISAVQASWTKLHLADEDPELSNLARSRLKAVLPYLAQESAVTDIQVARRSATIPMALVESVADHVGLGLVL